MFINETIIAVTFRLINFMAIIGLGLYIYRNYFSSSIHESIDKQNAAQQALFDQQVSLEKKQHELDTFIKKESIQCEELKTKITQWKNCVDKDSTAYHHQQLEQEARTSTKKTFIATHKEDDRIITIVTNKVIPELEQSLSHHFDNEKNGALYINSIIHHMNERIKKT